MRNPLRQLFASAVLIASVGTGACSSTDVTTPLPEGPPRLEIASLSAAGRPIVTPADAGAPCFAIGDASSSAACSSGGPGAACSFVITLKTDGSGQIPLELPDGSQPRFWTFAPPHGCYGTPDCGFAVLLIRPDREVAPCAPPTPGPHPELHAAYWKIAAGPAISVDFDDLRQKLGNQYGPTRVRVELWPAEGVPNQAACGRDGDAATTRTAKSGLWTETTIDFEPSCGTPAPDGGVSEAGTSDASDGAPRDASHDAARDARPATDSSAPDGAARPDASDSSVEGGAPSDGAPDRDAKKPSDSGAG